jgi:hypothetical protein
MLLHDGSEAYINDLPRAVKHGVKGYGEVEDVIQREIYRKYGIGYFAERNYDRMKELDARIVQHEKLEIMDTVLDWAVDELFPPLDGLVIRCWAPIKARQEFLKQFEEMYSGSRR